MGSEPPPQQADALGDPRELVSLMNPGSAQTVVTFESYEQLRDYSDLAAIGTISNVRIERTYGAPFVEPGVMAFDFRAQRLLGGRFANLDPGDTVTVILPMSATDEMVSEVLPRIRRLENRNRFAFFLFHIVEPHWSGMEGTVFEPILYGGPPAILAEWPGDGRLTDLQPYDYLLGSSEARGERATGTSLPDKLDWHPRFERRGLIGLTPDEAHERYAKPAGKPPVAAPTGWHLLEPMLAPPPKT